MIGGSGDDLVTGGTGLDTFVFGRGSGGDLIADFQAGPVAGDRIALDIALGVSSFADVLARATQVGDDTFIRFTPDTFLVLQNVGVARLSQENFAFVPSSDPAFL